MTISINLTFVDIFSSKVCVLLFFSTFPALLRKIVKRFLYISVFKEHKQACFLQLINYNHFYPIEHLL